MDKTYDFIQKAINFIKSNQWEQYNKIETNQSIPIRMRKIFTSIKDISQTSIAGLKQFKELIMINDSELIYAFLLDDTYSQQFRQCLRQIYNFVDQCLKRQNMAFEDSLFYKDVIKKISNDQQNQAEQFVTKKHNIAADKKENAIKLISQVRSLRSQSSIILEKEKDNDRRSQIEDELRAVEKSFVQSKDQIQKLQADVRRLKFQNKAIKDEEQKSLQNISILEDQNRKLKEDKKLLQSKVEMLELKLKNQKNEQIRLQQVITKVEQALLSKQRQVDKKSALNDELVIKIEELQNRPSSNNSSIHPQLLKKIPELFECAEKISFILSSSSNSSSSNIFSQINAQDSFSIQQDSFANHLKSKFGLSNSSMSNVKKQLGDFTSANIFVDYPSRKGGNFMKDLSSKKSIFLIGLAKNGSIIGGYLQNGIRLDRSSRSFIFSCNKQKSCILGLKRGKVGYMRDKQFLIFGQEELVLSPNSSYVSSYYEESAIVGDQFHYEGSISARENFLELTEAAPPRNKIALEKYELIQIIKK